MGNQYKSILKATSIFGGTQFLQILITIIRSKFVAVLLGTTGMGLSSIYMSSLTVVITIVGAGLNTTVVKELSKANEQGDYHRFSLIAGVFRKMLYALSFLGAVIVILSSRFLSWTTFNDTAHWPDYCVLSLLVVFTLLQQGNTSLLIGMRRIKDTAKCSIINSVVTLLTSIPIFYYFGIKGIAAGLVVSTFSGYLVTYYYAHKIKLPVIKVTWNDIVLHGKGLLLLGLALVSASVLGDVSRYLINISVIKMGGLSDLGLYNSGMSITAQSVTLIFAAMASDYFPRLAAVIHDKRLMNETINQQSEIIVLLITPILCAMMIASPLIIKVLLTDEFSPLIGFIRILCMGMFLKSVTYALGYASFAKGDKTLYFWLEGIYGNLSNVLYSLLGYYLFGLKGLAFSFLFGYLVYYFIIRYVDKKRYGYIQDNGLAVKEVESFVVLLFLLVLSFVVDNGLLVVIGLPICLYISIKYLRELNKLTGFITHLVTYIRPTK